MAQQARRGPGPLPAAELGYPSHLPVVAVREELLAAIRDHQIVVIAGETGSGKTTQLPKLCLELGLAAHGQIGHTQPRRIAARSVAERIAHELGTPIDEDAGGLVGYQVRFHDHTSDQTAIKVMTDGILLASLPQDRDLRRYSVLIIDEAHERSLNIDFLLGYLRQLLPRRPDLKVIITSATIDPQRFADHFSRDARGSIVRTVPVIEVSGRTYPVEIRYRPPAEGADGDLITHVSEAVVELWTEVPTGSTAHDILVFFSGEREIRDAQAALEALRLPQTDILPLFGRLSAAEQHRVFRTGPHRRVILATNVAETSLTVPGIGFVVDTGTARISRYSKRTKVQRLPIEPISQASANQRAGRCGRVADGVCIRLYSEEDFLARPEFTDPEILRTSLASVILAMTSLRLGDVTRFPFVDPPDSRQIADGVRLLEELSALAPRGPGGRGRGGRGHGGRGQGGRQLTAYGRRLARLPVDPRLGRMLLEAEHRGCTREVLVIVAALSIQDPRERPLDQQTQADQAHARFRDEHSDFASLHNLWRYLTARQRELSGSAFRRMCRQEFLHYLRVREWQDLHQQLRQAARSVGIDTTLATSSADGTPDWDAIHQALLSGLLSHIGLLQPPTREYAGARGARFSLAPGSTLFRRRPDYVMAGELVETSRVWARTNAAIDPAWAEELAGDLATRSLSGPVWSRSAGSVVASERVSLFGVTLAADRRVQYAPHDPEGARELFLRKALVEGDWEPRHRFWADNQQLLARVGELEEQARRRDLVVDDEVIYEFYDARIPPGVHSQVTFDRWWRNERRVRPELLTFTEELLRADHDGAVAAADYPATWTQGDLEFAVTYQFSPGSPEDGVSVHIPVTVLNQARDEGFDWQVPGMRADLVVGLVKSLPKQLRRHVVPAADHARTAMALLQPASGRSLVADLARVLTARTGVSVAPGDFDLANVPDHLRITFVIEGPDGQVLARGKELSALRARSAPSVRRQLARVGTGLERDDVRAWPTEGVPETLAREHAGATMVGYPALVTEGERIALRVLEDAQGAAHAHRSGVRALLVRELPSPWKRVLAALGNRDKLALASLPGISPPQLLQDALGAAVDAVLAAHAPGPVRTTPAYAAAAAGVRTHVRTPLLQILRDLVPTLELAAQVRRELATARAGNPAAALAATLADAQAHLDDLLRAGFVTRAGADRLPDLHRYVRGLRERLERAARNPREPQLQAEVEVVESAYADLLATVPTWQAAAPPITDVGWLIEELRVSLFAQALGTRERVSVKRVLAAIDTAAAESSAARAR